MKTVLYSQKNEYHDFIKSGSPERTCQNCVESIFPFNHIIDDNVFLGCLLELSYDCCLFDPEYVQPKIFHPFDLNDEKDYIPCSDIDPDSCYYNDLSYTIQMNSNYYHEDSTNHFLAKSFKDGETFSMMHLNIRSIKSNLSKLDQYMANLNANFDTIGISEIWLSDLNKYIDQLDGYNHESLVRPDRTHGRVSMFISSLIPYRVLNEICIVMKDIECLFIEIELNGFKIYIGIIYCTPDSDVRIFCDHLMNILKSLNFATSPAIWWATITLICLSMLLIIPHPNF